MNEPYAKNEYAVRSPEARETDKEKKYGSIFYRMIEGLGSPTVILDAKQKIVYANNAAEELFGDLVGRSSNFFFEEKTVRELSELIREDCSGHLRTTLADVTYDALFSAISDEENRRYLTVVLEDVSEKAYRENRLRENMQRLKNEKEIAKNIQNSILPIDDKYWNLLHVSSIYLPADDLGGDVFDLIKLEEDKILFYVADVSGHGIQASLLTMFVRENVRAKKDIAEEGLDVFIRELLKDFIDLDIDATIYISILLCVYDRAREELSIINAGHNCFPLVIRQGGRVEEIPVRGMPLSRISDAAMYEEEIIGMRPGDRLILYTDGVIEEYSRMEKKIFGSDGVRRVAEKFFDYEGKALAKKIVSEAETYMMTKAKDDRTVIIADML
ncbi:MAG: SpoIIE family protein phosphatase [Clostridiales Family XIII bacterium]|jgi:sigma-B regulation protein RsbU (phosphoserine phosphatase)|nr:SpoIIE family protein phosphatase [Clostridiales Family XIII bacterium]